MGDADGAGRPRGFARERNFATAAGYFMTDSVLPIRFLKPTDAPPDGACADDPIDGARAAAGRFIAFRGGSVGPAAPSPSSWRDVPCTNGGTLAVWSAFAAMNCGTLRRVPPDLALSSVCRMSACIMDKLPRILGGVALGCCEFSCGALLVRLAAPPASPNAGTLRVRCIAVGVLESHRRIPCTWWGQRIPRTW